MYINSKHEAVNDESASVDLVSDDGISEQLGKNSYLEHEVVRFKSAMGEVERSRIGKLAFQLERVLCRKYIFRKSMLLGEASEIARLPLDEREVFSADHRFKAFTAASRRSEFLTREYLRFLQEEGNSEAGTSIDEEAIHALGELNAKLYQQLLAVQVKVGSGLRGVTGFSKRLIDFLCGVFLPQREPRLGFLNSLWADFNDFRRDHADDLQAYKESRYSRMRYLFQILRYVVANPYASLRTFSWGRLLRLVRILFGREQVNGAAWIEQRFPLDSTSADKPVIFAIDDVTAGSVELEFPRHDQPLVSIIVPVYNQYATTISCLQALLAHTDGISYEVIIADDRSSDLTESIASRVKNIRVVRNEVNLGFLKNCNNAAKFAVGKFVLLLNNDTNPQPGWLQSLLDVFATQPDVGLVGPKLLFEDGVLQEAGGIIWRDGSGWNFGRGQSPAAPEYNYLRDVDYISGACVIVKKSLWDELGGFDELFCPAYYEDTDLAFQIRARGLRTIYQPASSVVHFEGVSHGSDINSGIKKQQRINQAVFRKKWKQELDLRNVDVGVDVFDAREKMDGEKTVLFIDHYVPFYDKDAGSRSTFLYVKTMVEMGYRVKFLGANFFPHQPYTETLQQLGVEVLYGERYARNWKLWLAENAEYLDVIYLHRPHITEDFIKDIKSLKHCPRLVYFGHDLHYLRTQREAVISGDKKLLKSAEDWKARESRIFQQVDTVLYPSDVEVDAVREIAPEADVAQLPLYVLDSSNIEAFEFAARKDLLFVGGFTHKPNVDAVLWFISEVMDKVHAVDPAIRLHVVGSNVPDVISDLASDNVIVHGFICDAELEHLYRSIRVCVVPLRYGAGVKGKVLEALQAGVPLVTTPIGAEGIPAPETVMSIAESADDFARELIALYTNEALCVRQLAERQGYIAQFFSQDVVRAAIGKHIMCDIDE
uniref:glycosyltransferase n=1 Tax=Microbulbifer agarilyticus TaxID=260552 RepID=UPI000255B934|nr:glycosyltransferase [Microbulbifer agarilyticus]